MSPPFRSSAPTRSRLELDATVRWRRWGDGWAMFARCDGCGGFAYVRGRTRRRLLCLGCFDQGGRA